MGIERHVDVGGIKRDVAVIRDEEVAELRIKPVKAFVGDAVRGGLAHRAHEVRDAQLEVGDGMDLPHLAAEEAADDEVLHEGRQLVDKGGKDA